jgi:hypothetical protein
MRALEPVVNAMLRLLERLQLPTPTYEFFQWPFPQELATVESVSHELFNYYGELFFAELLTKKDHFSAKIQECLAGRRTSRNS